MDSRPELPFTIELEDPISIGKGENIRTFNELVIEQKPKGKCFKGLNLNNMTYKDACTLIARVCSIPINAVEELSASDHIKVQEAINLFL